MPLRLNINPSPVSRRGATKNLGFITKIDQVIEDYSPMSVVSESSPMSISGNDLDNFEQIYNEFPDRYKDKILDLIQSEECTDISPSDNQGAFGTISIENDCVTKQLNLLNKDIVEQLLITDPENKLDFLMNRFINFDKDTNNFVRETKLYFPHNFLDVSNFFYYINKRRNKHRIFISMKMKREKGHEQDMKQMLNQLTEKEINSISAQIYIITTVLNSKHIYHNDTKPANILIGKAPKDFSYNFLGLKLKIFKGERIPIFIDYDLHSMDKLRLPDIASFFPLETDYDFFNESINKTSLFYKPSDFLNILSKLSHDTFNLEKIVELFTEEGLNVKC